MKLKQQSRVSPKRKVQDLMDSLLYCYLKQTKMPFLKNGVHEGKTSIVWVLVPMGG
jgi:hypothetical protein